MTPYPASCRYAVLEIVLVSVLGWGVVGAALAPAIGQYCGLVVMLVLLFRERALLPEHFSSPPSLASIMPLLKVSAVVHCIGRGPPSYLRFLRRHVLSAWHCVPVTRLAPLAAVRRPWGELTVTRSGHGCRPGYP